MNPQLLMPSPAADFNFDSTTTSPYATAPSSPKFFNTSSASFHRSPINPDDFAFDFSGHLELPPSISDADELFHGGKIKPLDPPPLDHNINQTLHKDHIHTNHTSRGRERTLTTTNTTRHKASRSLSPLRVSDVLSDNQIVVSTISTNQSSSSPFGFTWYNKWNLKNLLLFRSTSEGSATVINDELKKFTKGDEDKGSSFRSSDGGGGGGGPVGGGCSGRRRRMKRKMSAHEMHYTANRAVAEEMRRKTFLPYRSGLLGCLGFGHDVHEVSRRR